MPRSAVWSTLLALTACSYDWSAQDADGDGVTADEGDCWDAPLGPAGSGLVGADIKPGQAETWYDGVDQDCAGDSDFDQDGDGFDAEIGGGADCDDTSAAVNPAVEEVWYDGVDANCDGASDYDADGDGADGQAWGGADCDDADPAMGPDAEEIWYDGVDQDCDGASDYDADGDGYPSDEYAVGPDADCDDADPGVNPGAAEIWYDGVDQDCAGDDDFDQDGDGFESAELGDGDDCDDASSLVFPGAVEVWYDGVDQDCDAGSDYDADGDGQDAADFGGADCDDARARTYDGAVELCNLVDDNCDGAVDEGYSAVDAVATHADLDSDGFGDPDAVEYACATTVPDGYVLDDTDCDDSNPEAYPGAEEQVGDEVDQDCDGAEICYQDLDGDAWRTDLSVASSDLSCADPGEATAAAPPEDCDDEDPDRHPGAVEGPGDGVDQNCDLAETCFVDADDDGFRLDDTVDSPDLSCAGPGEAEASDPATDCDDADGSVNPGAEEICDGAGVDEDCDALVNEEDPSLSDASSWAEDADGDGFGDPATAFTACEAPDGAVGDATDCDDGDRLIYPGALERCDGVADDCDSGWISDDGLVSFYASASGDWSDWTDAFNAGTALAPAEVRVEESGAVSICSGTWYASVEVAEGLDLDLVGLDGALATALDGGGVARPLTAHGGGALRVSGITLMNGYASDGGGAWLSSVGASVALSDVVLLSNLADGQGGGLCWGCGGGDGSAGALRLDGVTVSGNLATEGGGLALIGGGPVSAADLEISENLAVAGGGLSIVGQTASLRDSLVVLNEAEDGAGAMVLDGGALDLVNVGVFYNLASVSVGGVALVGSELRCTGDPADDALGVFGNAVGGEPGYQIALDADAIAIGEACDLADSDAGGDGIIYNQGDLTDYSYGLDASFACDASGCADPLP